jgi:hypothetical protein
MKRVETYKGSGDFVNAVQEADLASLRPVFKQAEDAWYSEWVARGCKDEGSCCLGVGVSIYYLPSRARQPRPMQVIYWNGSQGDFEAERTKQTPIRMLTERGIDAFYNCGRLD